VYGTHSRVLEGINALTASLDLGGLCTRKCPLLSVSILAVSVHPERLRKREERVALVGTTGLPVELGSLQGHPR
jgi:hypothetical protein